MQELAAAGLGGAVCFLVHIRWPRHSSFPPLADGWWKTGRSVRKYRCGQKEPVHVRSWTSSFYEILLGAQQPSKLAVVVTVSMSSERPL